MHLPYKNPIRPVTYQSPSTARTGVAPMRRPGHQTEGRAHCQGRAMTGSAPGGEQLPKFGALGTSLAPPHPGHTSASPRPPPTPTQERKPLPSLTAQCASMRGRGCVPIKLYLQNLGAGRIWLEGSTLPPLPPEIY